MSKRAERGAQLSILTYILLASAKVVIGTNFLSQAVQADGWNNFTDVLSSLAVLIGLYLARRPADDDHPYGHWKAETIASLITSFLMLGIGIRILLTAFDAWAQTASTQPDWLTAWIGLIGGGIMLTVHQYNKSLAANCHSTALAAVAKDNLNDALTSFSTVIAVACTKLFQLFWIDAVMAIIVGLIIVKTAFGIFQDSAFALSDGFDQEQLVIFKQSILAHPHVLSVQRLHARHYGAKIYVDVTITVDPLMTVRDSHRVTEEVELILQHKHHVVMTDVHVEPHD